jgi:hypothetical protein
MRDLSMYFNADLITRSSVHGFQLFLHYSSAVPDLSMNIITNVPDTDSHRALRLDEWMIVTES